MRIISGIYGSRRIKAKIPANVRPTSDQVRESVYNILNNIIDFSEIRVLDLFSGTGAFAFEALSRGASFATLVEKNNKTSTLIKSIASDLNIPNNNYKVINTDVIKFLKSNINEVEKYNLIFADPPYDDENIYNELINNLPLYSGIDKDTLIVLEYRTINKIELPATFNIINERKFGDTSFLIFEIGLLAN